MIPSASRRANSLDPNAFANLCQSVFRNWSLSPSDVAVSHAARCHALSARARTRGNNIWCDCSFVRTVSDHRWPWIPGGKHYYKFVALFINIEGMYARQRPSVLIVK